MCDNAKLNLGTQRHEYANVPSQEIILVCVFVIYLHLQLLTRHFMDYNLMHRTHTHKDMKTDRGNVWKLAAASCDHE